MSVNQIIAAGAVAGAVLSVAAFIVLVWRGVRRVGRVSDAILGAPAQDGLPERPGIVTQLALLRDDVAGLGDRVDAHLSWHSGHEPSINGMYPPIITEPLKER